MSVFALLASSLVAASLPEPLALASDGQLQCIAPDTARKSCLSLASYKARDDGTIEVSAEVLISSRPLVTMEAALPVEVLDGRVCGSVRDQDIDAAAFNVGGMPLDEDQSEALRVQVRGQLKSVIGRRVCATFIPQGVSFLAKATVDGAPQPAMDQTVIWVAPSQGYSVGP
jgi:hypothetical protein